MRVVAVLMHRNDIIEVALIGLEEPLGHVGRNVAHILSARIHREGHQQMCGLPKFGFEPAVPPLGKALGQILDVTRLELRFAIEEPATVHDMSRLGGEVIELVCELRFGMRPPTPDRLEDRRPVPCCRAHELGLLGHVQPLHRAPDAAPAIPEDLARDGMDGIIQPHGQTPSARP